MGVQGLTQQLKPAMETVGLGRFKGKRVAVDGNVWIHRGTYACASDISDSDGYVFYCRKLARLLLDHGIRPLIVLDGHSLPAKGPERERRRRNRERARHEMGHHDEQLRELEAQRHGAGQRDFELENQLAAARRMREDAARRAVAVTMDMIERVMLAMQQMDGVQVMRAPYEADAQLAHLARSGRVDAVLTEDSDLIAYACPCVLLKLDRFKAEVQMVTRKALFEINGRTFSLRGYTPEMLLHMCILSGVDYLDSPKGMGIKTANKWIRKLRDGPQVIRHFKVYAPGGVRVPDGYAEAFGDALLTFLHQRVWDEMAGAVVPLTGPLPDGAGAEIDGCIGPHLPDAAEWVYMGLGSSGASGPAERAPAGERPSPFVPLALDPPPRRAGGVAPREARGCAFAGVSDELAASLLAPMSETEMHAPMGAAAPAASAARADDWYSQHLRDQFGEEEPLIAGGPAEEGACEAEGRGAGGDGGGGGGGRTSDAVGASPRGGEARRTSPRFGAARGHVGSDAAAASADVAASGAPARKFGLEGALGGASSSAARPSPARAARSASQPVARRVSPRAAANPFAQKNPFASSGMLGAASLPSGTGVLDRLRGREVVAADAGARSANAAARQTTTPATSKFAPRRDRKVAPGSRAGASGGSCAGGCTAPAAGVGAGGKRPLAQEESRSSSIGSKRAAQRAAPSASIVGMFAAQSASGTISTGTTS